MSGRDFPGGLLEGRTAIVTGASSGIGRDVALGLAAAGASVAVNYASDERAAAEVVERTVGAGGSAAAIQANVADEGDVQRMFAAVKERLGPVDILVSNAGIQKDAPFVEMSLAQWNAVIGVNLTGQFLCAREAARGFIERGIPEGRRAAGVIICMSSVHEVIPWAGHVNYAASKGGVMMMMKSMAQELAPHGIRVNSIAPGAIRTPINTGAWSTSEALERLLQLIPYGRIGEPEDIARAAVWLASDEADYVNGTTLFVDGGMTLYPEFARGG